MSRCTSGLGQRAAKQRRQAGSTLIPSVSAILRPDGLRVAGHLLPLYKGIQTRDERSVPVIPQYHQRDVAFPNT
jgi:hypothetical protein